MEPTNSSKWMKIGIGILVAVILAEAGYFLYSRYLGPSNLSLKEMSTSETIPNQESTPGNTSQTQPYPEGEFVRYPNLHVNKDKVLDIMDYLDRIPNQMLTDSTLSVGLVGTLVETGDFATVVNEVDVVWKLTLINPGGERVSMFLSEREVQSAEVRRAESDGTENPIKLENLEVGDNLAITQYIDLIKTESGNDKLVITARRKN